MENKQFTITKKIAKHGRQAVIIVPACLMQELKPGTLTELTIKIIENKLEDKEDSKNDY